MADGYDYVVTEFELIVVLLAAAIPLVLLAERLGVASPILLVLAGLGVGFIPNLPPVTIPPDLILVIFLPPLLYSQAVSAPTRAFRVFATPILRLAFGLVVVTAAGVAAVTHALVPSLPWAAAIAFGAVVAPTDEVAFVAVAERLRLPQRVLAIVQGESLLNDATALVIFAVAIEAAVRNQFSWLAGGLRLVATCGGSVAIGLVVGWLVVRVLHALHDSMLQVLLALLAGYIAYIPAQHLGLSGVLATVTTGFYVARFAARGIAPKTRVLNRGTWDVLIFILNTTIFFIVGLQLRPIVSELHGISWPTLLAYAAAVNVMIFALRLFWLMGIAYPIDRYIRRYEDVPPWRTYAIVAWSGIRGGVSLAAALAIPMTIAAHTPFPHRALLLFLTFSVIVVTLIGQGGTLPALIRALGVREGGEEEREEESALVRATKTSLGELERLTGEGRVDKRDAEKLRARYEKHVLDEDAGDEVRALYRAEAELLAEQHGALVGMRDRGEIENTTLRHLETQLDFKRLQLAEEIDRRSDGNEEPEPERR